MSALASGPWLRAPLLLLRRPVVFLAIVVSTAVLGIAASSGVLFTSTLGTASLDAQAADDCPELSMPSFFAATKAGNTAAENAAGAAAMRRAGLRDPYWVDLAGAQIQSVRITLYARTGALAHVHTLTPNHGQPGAWLPDTFAAMLKVHAGDTVTTTDGAAIHVAGIYRSLSSDPFHLSHVPRYWCTWNDLIVQKINGNIGTPPFLITDPATIDTVIAKAKPVYGFHPAVSANWFSPLPADASIADAKADQQRAADAWGAYLSNSTRALRHVYGRGALLDYRHPKPPKDSPLGKKIAIADDVHDGLAGSVLPIDLAGAVIALLLVAGAGGFWAAHRQREIALLSARGVGPFPLAIKAVLETLPAVLIGLAAGVLSAIALVRGTGPADVFTPGAIGSATGAACGAAAAGLVIIAIIGALAGRERTIGFRRSRWRHVPVEVILIAFAIWAWARIRSGSGIEFDHAIVDVRPLLLLFPLLGVTGVLLLCARALAFAVPRLTSNAERLGSAGFLALRRIGGSRAIAIGLLVGTALPCGLLAYAGTVSTGVHHELIRKYQTNLGAPVVLQLIGVREDNPKLDGHGTAVVRYDNGPTLPGGTQLAVVGVAPDSFGDFAYSTPDQRHQVAQLQGTGASTPALFINASGIASPSEIRLGATRLHVHVLARRSVFPGLRNGSRPLLVVNRAALAHVDPSLNRANEVWTTPAQVSAADTLIKRDGYRVLGRLDPAVRVGNSGLLPITWIFGYLRALAVLIGAVAIAGLVFALNARTSRRTVAYVMSRRMGLTQGTHLRSLLIELTAVVGIGWLLGTGLGFAGYAVLTRSLDVDPELPPGAAFDLPALTLAVTAAVVAVVIVAAAAGAHLAAERARPADILRLE